MNKFDAPFELKAVDDKGNFEGYASVFNNVDSGNDVILPAAFSKVKTNKEGKLVIALYHDLTKIIGKADFTQDDRGLYVKGNINLNVSYAKDAYELMKDNTLDSMSIGFNIIDSEQKSLDGKKVRVIKSAELWEASIVPFGMNVEAKITSVKSDIRTFENALKERLGLSQKEAATVASKSFSLLCSDCKDDDAEIATSDLKIAVETTIQDYFKGVTK